MTNMIGDKMPLNSLPSEINLEIGKKLSINDKANLARTSRYYHQLFQPELDARCIIRFLLHVLQGKQDKALAMLTQCPALLLKSGDVMDYSSRTFKKITAYEYAYWANDTHMCRMLESFMEEADKVIILQLIDAIEEDGLTYMQHGIAVEQSKHFICAPLTELLQRFDDDYDEWMFYEDWDAVKAAWMQIGREQCNLPAHMVQEYYCKSQDLDLPRSMSYFDTSTLSTKLLFPLVMSEFSGLGRSFAICRGKEREAVMAVWGWGGYLMGTTMKRPPVLHDKRALSRLDNARTADRLVSRDNLMPELLPSTYAQRCKPGC